MARRKSSRKPAPRRRSAKAGSARVWPWLLSLAAIGTAIYVHDNQTSIEDIIARYGGTREAARPQSAHPQVARASVTPKPIWRAPDAKAPSVQPSQKPVNVAYVPPAAIGVPASRPLTGSIPTGRSEGGRFKNTFYYCGTSGLDNCVASGDTIWFHKQRIVLADIAAPATEKAQCQQERDRGFAAKVRLRELLNAGHFELASAGGTVSSAEAQLVTRNGKSLGAILVSEGLASPRSATPHWCP